MNQLVNGLVLLQAASGGSTAQMLTTLIPFGLVFVIMYFLIIRPQNKKQKEAKAMVEAMKKGDKVVTIGGVHAVVHAVKETTVILKVDENTKMEFSKSAVQAVTAKGAEKAEDKGAEEDKPSEEKK
jgi:preprotein translocase subunit YajC